MLENPIIGDIIGITGVLIIVLAYILMQIDRMDAKGFLFSLLNTIGAIFILISLLYDWNLASFVMEVIWLTLSFYGTIRGYKKLKS
ncbi:MAG: hypothetical protein NT103_05050 [Campylobacterales bacterium]|nr:hypothetical protein [Campylobacterales bacterium]